MAGRLVGRKSTGFSLLEVLLGAMLFAAVFFGLAASWKFHELSLRKYRNRNAARFLIQQEMERVMAHSYVNLEEGVRSTSFELTRKIDGVSTAQEFVLDGDLHENAVHTLKDIRLTLSFRESNQDQSLTLRSRVFRGQ